MLVHVCVCVCVCLSVCPLFLNERSSEWLAEYNRSMFARACAMHACLSFATCVTLKRMRQILHDFLSELLIVHLLFLRACLQRRRCHDLPLQLD